MSSRPAVLAGLALEEPCGSCAGRGLLDDPRWTEWERAGQEIGEEPRDGFGNLAPRESSCPDCGRRGVRPTKDGLQLLKFVQRWRDDFE